MERDGSCMLRAQILGIRPSALHVCKYLFSTTGRVGQGRVGQGRVGQGRQGRAGQGMPGCKLLHAARQNGSFPKNGWCRHVLLLLLTSGCQHLTCTNSTSLKQGTVKHCCCCFVFHSHPCQAMNGDSALLHNVKCNQCMLAKADAADFPSIQVSAVVQDNKHLACRYLVA